MVQAHSAAGDKSAKRFARAAIAAGMALSCALAATTAAAEPPRSAPPGPLNPAPYATSERLPPVDGTSQDPSHTASPLLSAFGTPSAYDPFARQVSYVAAANQQNAAQGNPLSSLNPGQPFRFAPVEQQKTAAVANQEDEAAGADQPEGEKPEGEEQTYGQAPTNNALQFLRDVDVLLKPGAWQADTGFVYTHFSDDFPIPVHDGGGTIVNVIDGEFRNRLLFTPLAVRYGLTDNVQLFGNLPVGYSNTQVSTFGVSESEDTGGLGDLTAGATIHLLDSVPECGKPDVIGTFGFTAPTGDFNAPVFSVVPGSALGTGFWAVNAQLLFVHRYDPVIVFYGAGYRHLFEREFDDLVFAPGEQINYMMGVGFSVNDRVTLSGTFQGFYITDSFIDGEDVPGTNLEPLSMRFAATMVRDCRIIEPFVQIGMTPSAPRANFGIVFTFY